MATKLSPLEEVLFQSWARAHGVKDHDHPSNQFDHRGLYKQTNGMILPGHVVRDMAQTHNKAMEAQAQGGDGGSMEFPDPYAAQAEMHGNMLKAQGDQAKLKAQSELEDKKHQQKLELEKMKLAHASAEKDKDRQHKAMEQRQAQIQHQQDAERARQQAQMDMHQQRQFQLQDNQAAQQHEMKSAVMQEQLARSRPQPQPTHQGPPQAAQPHAGGLEHQLMQRQGQGRLFHG